MSWLLIIPLMIVCLFLNIRVYLAMFIGIIAYFLFFSSVPIEIAVQRLIAPTQSPSLLAIPFFILLGTLMSYTGIAERILHIANVLVGKMRGGLGVANILYDVLKLVLELFDQEDNTYDVTVISASPLSEEQKARLLAIVSQKFEIKTRRLVEKIDEDLIGGFVIKAKNKVVDTSIRSQLQTFKTNLK